MKKNKTKTVYIDSLKTLFALARAEARKRSYNPPAPSKHDEDTIDNDPVDFSGVKYGYNR